MRISAILLSVFALLLVASCSQPNQLRIITEEWPPYNYTADGELKGMSVEIVQQMQSMLGDQTEIEVMDWDEGYELALSRPNTAIFTTGLTPERADEFEWVGPFALPQFALFSLAGDEHSFSGMDEAHAATIVAPKGYAILDILDKFEFENVVLAENSSEAIRMVHEGEADLFGGSTTNIAEVLEKAGYAADSMNKDLVLNTMFMGMAFSKSTPAATVQQWRDTFEGMMRSGEFAAIHGKWFPQEPTPQHMQLITEDYPPLSFEAEGEITGLGPDMVRQICKITGDADDIRLLPWYDGYQLASIAPNVALFTMKKTPEREPNFHWIGPLGSNKTYFYTDADAKLAIDTMETAKQLDGVAVVNGWFSAEHLENEGFENLVYFDKPADAVRSVLNGKIAAGVFTDVTLPQIANEAGYSINDLRPTFMVSEGDYYIALSQKTPDEKVTQWREAFEQCKADGVLDALYQNWLPMLTPPQ